jgi:hypothetical protein
MTCRGMALSFLWQGTRPCVKARCTGPRRAGPRLVSGTFDLSETPAPPAAYSYSRSQERRRHVAHARRSARRAPGRRRVDDADEPARRWLSSCACGMSGSPPFELAAGLHEGPPVAVVQRHRSVVAIARHHACPFVVVHEPAFAHPERRRRRRAVGRLRGRARAGTGSGSGSCSSCTSAALVVADLRQQLDDQFRLLVVHDTWSRSAHHCDTAFHTGTPFTSSGSGIDLRPFPPEPQHQVVRDHRQGAVQNLNRRLDDQQRLGVVRRSRRRTWNAPPARASASSASPRYPDGACSTPYGGAVPAAPARETRRSSPPGEHAGHVQQRIDRRHQIPRRVAPCRHGLLRQPALQHQEAVPDLHHRDRRRQNLQRLAAPEHRCFARTSVR